MKLVLDVSAAFAIVMGKAEHERILDKMAGAEVVIAPDLFYAEATIAAWKYFRFGGLSKDRATRLAERSIELIDVIFPSEKLWIEAMTIAMELKIPSYDCYYLALAIAQGAFVLSLDKKLNGIAKNLSILA